MAYEDEYFRTLSERELWQRYCGFLDISMDEFMEIQKRLLMAEIEQVADSFLGKKIMKNGKPGSIEEFRQTVPLTTYNDYEPYLSERQEDVLAEKPLYWCHSAGRRGFFKWIPWTKAQVEVTSKYAVSTCILSTAHEKGDINFRPGARVLGIIAPPPYALGSLLQHLPPYLTLNLFPDLSEAADINFQTRLERGFRLALQDGADIVFSLSSVLVKMGESFTQRQKKTKLSPAILANPRFAMNILRAMLVSKKNGRTILPRDLCPIKAAVTLGTDTSIYKDEIINYWGVEPFEMFAGSDSGLVAMQCWDKKKGMYFMPDIAFLEFIPEEEVWKWEKDTSYQPKTILLNEVKAGKAYELVITRFHGMPLLRYRIGDVLKFVTLEDKETGINIPEMMFHHRVGETIDLAGLARLDERTIWRALANTGIKYEEWSACKEYEGSQSILRVYIELRENKTAEEISSLLNEQLKKVDIDYQDIGAYLELQPVRVTLLSPGTFQQYLEEKQSQGADLAHLKPAHINAPEQIIKRLLELNKS